MPPAASSSRVTNCPPAEWPEITIALRFGKFALFASARTIASIKSYDVSFGLLLATPPDRQLSPPHGQLTSLGASVSRQPVPLFDAMRGEITIVSLKAFARNAAARLVRK